MEALIYKHPELKSCLDDCICGGHGAVKAKESYRDPEGILVCTRCNWQTKHGKLHEIMVEWNQHMRNKS